MTERSYTFYSVGNGNFTFIQVDDFSLVVDMKAREGESVYETLKNRLRTDKDGVYILDILTVSHGDQDHCGGFSELKDAMDNSELIIGSIWHSNVDRTDTESRSDLPKDYLDLRKEILRRRDESGNSFGNIEVPLVAGQDMDEAFEGLTKPDEFEVLVCNPSEHDDVEDYDNNDLSLVLKVKIDDQTVLLPGDSGSEVWQDRIIPSHGEDVECGILVASHHGSFSFFGTNRDEVREADPHPDNYIALDKISPLEMVVSATSKFPTNKDSSGDQPPHYAAWKWYHKWFRDNRDVDENDKHPDQFKYTCDADLKYKKYDDGWSWDNSFDPDDGDGGDKGRGIKHSRGSTERPGSKYAKNTA